MSGTSRDGIDACVIDIGISGRAQLVAASTTPYPADLAHQLAELVSPGPDELSRAGQLDHRLACLFAESARQLLSTHGMHPRQIIAIGSHGHTIRHAPETDAPFTWQLGDPSRIAALTGIVTIADFRRMDLACGGQGAPLVPSFHAAHFACPQETRAVVNIGGIANLTALPRDFSSPVFGFDTGPGNTLMNVWTERHRGQPWDRAGQWAASGNIHRQLLDRLFTDPYFQRRPPKSTGPETFNLTWLERHCVGLPLSPEDIQATLCALTVQSILLAIDQHVPDAERIILCGGGVHNQHLVNSLTQSTRIPVETTAQHGLDPDQVEAAAFAWLAYRHLAGLPGNLPAVTGARCPAILGGCYLPMPQRQSHQIKS